jgi:hypothetical protein
MVYEVIDYYSYRTGYDIRRNKESSTKGVQKSKFRVVVHHKIERDQTGTNMVCMGFRSTI